MYPPQFLTLYPVTATAFAHMVRRDISMRGKNDGNAIKAELLKQPFDRSTVEALCSAVWTDVNESRAEFAVRTGDAFGYLGVCDEVRTLIGSIWAAAFREWNPAEQLEFLRVLLTHDEVHRELAFEFLPWAAPDLKLPAQDFWAWVVDSRQGRDAYPHRIAAILETHARNKPQEALELAGLFLRQPSDPANARLIALLVHWVRETERKQEVLSHLSIFETTLASGPVEHRSILLESWAFSATTPALDQSTAAALKQKLVRGAPEEAKAWCFLLQQVVVTSPAKLSWAIAELRALAHIALPAEQKFLAFTAALHGWLNAGPMSPVSRAEWEGLVRSLAPFKADETAVWSHLEYFLVDAFQQDAGAAIALVGLIAETSGKGWSKVLEENESNFGWWCQTLHTNGQAEAVVTMLCFSDVRPARRVGLHVVRRCGPPAFSATAISQATTGQVERLLLEATLKLADYDFIGRIHLAFAERVEQLGGKLVDWFHDEVLTQALNTNKYRQAILHGATSTSTLRAVVAEAERRIEASAKASESPALKMRIPGHARAESLSMRRFGREVAKGVAKYSVFSQLFPTIHLLYGKSWRMSDATGALGAAGTLTKMEVSTEMPRLEFMTPEAMRHRRLMAVKRIVELDRGVEEEA